MMCSPTVDRHCRTLRILLCVSLLALLGSGHILGSKQAEGSKRWHRTTSVRYLHWQ